MYEHLYNTDHYHDIPMEVLGNDQGWYQARVTEGPALNLSSFSKEPANAVEDLEHSLRGIALLGFDQPAEFCYRPARPKRKK